MFNYTKKKLVIIGGGYAGIELLKNLDFKYFSKVILIDEKSEHLHQTDIHKFICSEIPKEKISFSFTDYCYEKEISFIHTKVKDIDFKNKNIISTNSEISYDYLVIATGSKSFFPKQIKNIENYSKDIKNIQNLNNYRNQFLKMLKDTKTYKNIAIIGGGLSGVEIAIEFAQKLKENNISKDKISISIIEQQSTILPNVDQRLIDKTTDICDELQIERYHGNFVTQIEDKTIFLNDGRRIHYDMIIINIGVACERLFKEENIKTNQKNQIVVDKFLRIPNFKEVFIIGDIAETKNHTGEYNLPTAQIAKLHGKITAKNIIKSIKNQELITNCSENSGVLIDLAGKNAIGLIKDFEISGAKAYYLKRFVSYLHKRNFD